MQTDAKNLNLILDSLKATGIYVIRAEDHRILFYNQTAKDIVPGIRVGAVCSDTWGGSCAVCPLIDIGDKETNQSFNYDGPNHQATDIVATRTLWDGKTPAFIVSFSPHAETYNSTYEKIVKGNLTTDECVAIKMAENERARLPETFTLHMALRSFVESGLLYEEDIARFLQFSSFENMSRELKSGKKVLVCNYRRVTERGRRWNTMEVLPDVNYTDENQSIIIYVKDVQDIYREGLSHEALSLKNEAILKTLGKENFGIYVVNLDTGRAEWIRVADGDRSFIHEGASWDEVMEELAGQRYHPDYREKFRSAFARPALSAAMRAGKEKEELMLERKIGERWCYVNATAFFHRDAAGQNYAILAFQNVDDYIRRELEHIHVEQHMASVIRSGFSVMNYVDLDTGACERSALGKTADARPAKGDYEEWIQRAAHNWVLEDDRERFLSALSIGNLRQTAAAVGDYKEEIVQYRIKRGEDSFRWLEEHIFYIRQDDKVDVSIFGRDVTDEKLREEAERQEDERDKAVLEDALKTANAANAAKSDFLSRMSHDIRTPMNAIIGMTAIAGTHLDDKERVTDCLTKITASGKHLLSLINEVLDLSKIESGRLELSEEEFELSIFFDELMSMVLPSIHAKKQSLNVKLHDVKHEKVVADMLRLQQVCINILSNAVKYTPEGGTIDVELHERPSTVAGYGYYDFVFRDNGIGMPEEYLKHLFEPFSRAENPRAKGAEGTGLGMAIVKNIVQMMSGDIGVKSKVNEGSEFTVSLFLKLGENDGESIQALIDLPVLVADDDRDACEAACLVIDELGMKSEWVLSGAEAVEKVDAAHRREEDYFAVILDWKMPGMDGLETARQIRQAVGPEVPIIILSAYDWTDIEEEARQAGVNGFIAKPLFKSRLAYLFKQFTGEAEGEKSPGDELQAIEQMDYSGKRLLLVEDNDLNREIAQEIIGMTGVTIDCAVNGKEAAEMFKASPPGYYDLIFMDIQMPVMNGYEATRAIRAMDRADASTVPIIAMSANAFATDIQESKRAGMNEHIIKPLDFKRLTKCLDKWLR